MAVVINEFEVVPGDAAPPQQQQQNAAGQEGGGDKKSPPSEHEIARLVERRMNRAERIWAH
jgi:hypothetical protein